MESAPPCGQKWEQLVVGLEGGCGEEARMRACH